MINFAAQEKIYNYLLDNVNNIEWDQQVVDMFSWQPIQTYTGKLSNWFSVRISHPTKTHFPETFSNFRISIFSGEDHIIGWEETNADLLVIIDYIIHEKRKQEDKEQKERVKSQLEIFLNMINSKEKN